MSTVFVKFDKIFLYKRQMSKFVKWWQYIAFVKIFKFKLTKNK